jgi:hypothetical protein
MHLFTADGLFVSTLFNDIRLRPNWAAPVAVRNMDVTDVSLHDENFWPSITQTADGHIFLVDGARTSLVRVDGLETLTPIPEQTITITPADLERMREWFAKAEARRQQAARQWRAQRSAACHSTKGGRPNLRLATNYRLGLHRSPRHQGELQ